MTKLDKLIKQVEKARSETLAKPPVRLSHKYRHYTVKVTQAQREMRRINRINRNAPVISYQVDSEA